jgi:hypothetical protein
MANLHRSEVDDVDSSTSSVDWEEQEEEEQDETPVKVVSLFDAKGFLSAQEMLLYTKTNFGFDLISHIKSHGIAHIHVVFVRILMLGQKWTFTTE